MKADVSIVIPTWNGLALLQTYLPSVFEAASVYIEKSAAHIEIILVDDGSTDETEKWLSQHPPSITGIAFKYLKNSTNLGFSLSCNRGIEAARHPLILLLNNDVEPDPTAIAPLVEVFADPTAFAVHCQTIELPGGKVCGVGKVGDFKRGFIRVHQSYTVAQAPLSEPNRLRLYSMFAGGGAAMFDREKLLSVGGFNHLFSPYYWEDVELSYRAWKRGYSVYYEPRSVVRHRISSTISRLNQRKVRLVEQRNRLIYHWIHLHDRRLLGNHILWLIGLVLTAPLRFKPLFVLAFIEALKRLPEITEQRRKEKSQAKRSDREIFNQFIKLKEHQAVKIFDKFPTNSTE
jgi:GT2 family glycosyltransferase